MVEKRTGSYDIQIAIENTDGFKEYEKKAIGYLIESPYFALIWDIGYSKATGEKDGPFIIAHDGKLRHFHIHGDS